ncbi:MAG: metalloregulator ArsR/SmtB family transcription factor [bacterium]|nr:metalloregulator ArsR/SmtB family transcription factor [bacterium]
MLKELEKVIKALADKNRIRIIKMLQQREMCVCEIREVLGLSQPSVSKHLKILKDAGIIEDNQKGLWTNYYINSQNDYARSLSGLVQGWLAKDIVIQNDLRQAKAADRSRLCLTGKGRGR